MHGAHVDDGPSVPGAPADDPLAPIVARRGIVVLDGGLATKLEAQGNSLADALWSARLLLENPGEIVRAHLAFYRAGAAVATTASYQATFEGFAARGIDHAGAIGLLRRSVALASEARAAWQAERPPADLGPLLVAASIGPYGAFLANGGEYTGRYGRSVAELRDLPSRTARGADRDGGRPARLRDDPGARGGDRARRAARGNAGRAGLAQLLVRRRRSAPERRGRGGGVRAGRAVVARARGRA